MNMIKVPFSNIKLEIHNHSGLNWENVKTDAGLLTVISVNVIVK